MARLEDNLRRVELGTLVLEAGADMPTALLTLTSGVLKQKPKLEKAPLLGELLDLYMKSIPELAIETSTWKMLHTHMAHLKRLLGVLTRPSSFSLEHLQAYVNSRSQDKGLRGKPLSPTTIKKELAMLTTVRSWGIESGLVSQSLPRKSRLRYGKVDEKPPFKTWVEIERLVKRGGLTEDEAQEYWDCVYLN